MKKNYIYIIIGIVVILTTIYFLVNREKPVEEVTMTENEIYRELVNLRFTYPFGIDGYSLSEATSTPIVSDLRSAFVLSPVKLDEAVQTDQNEPKISIFVFQKSTTTEATATDRIARLKDVAQTYQNLTGYNQTVTANSVEIDGVEAIVFNSSLNRPQISYVAEAFGKNYIFIGQYESDTDKIKVDFERIVKSVNFD